MIISMILKLIYSNKSAMTLKSSHLCNQYLEKHIQKRLKKEMKCELGDFGKRLSQLISMSGSLTRIHHPNQTYSKHENKKRRHYSERVMNVKDGTFTPLIYSINGGIGPECSTYHKHLADKLACKTGERYEKIVT